VAVPRSEALDRVHRADAAAERNLNRAIDRLEGLQHRRQGEAVPAVSVRLTR
jgi:G:T-mismatch repair DNA endonuclease (very short patch repair protein)